MRNIIINGEDHGQYDEEALKAFMAKQFFNNVKQIYNSIDNVTVLDIYVQQLLNATILDFEDVIPSQGNINTIYIELSNNNSFNIYLYFNNVMTLVGNINFNETKGIMEVDQLPDTHDQNIIYKVRGVEALFWWNGTEYANISSDSGMISVLNFPTGQDIREGTLYKLTKNISHLGDLKYVMIELEYNEGDSTDIPTEGYYHATDTDKWYKDGSELNIEPDQTLPEPKEENENNYYVIGGDLLYQCQHTRPVIVDYYSGIYAYMNGDWRSLYTSNLMVGYETGIVQSTLPIINNRRVVGSHDIGYYGAITKSQADGIYQSQEMENPISGFVANDIEGTIHELNNKVSFTIRIKGNVDTNEDLDDIVDPSVGDVWIVKVDTTEEEERNAIMWCWNGTEWFEYGQAGVDMSKYQKFEQKIASLKAANPGLTFADNCSLAVTDAFTIARIEATLNVPVTDIQSADRTLLVIPNDIDIHDGDLTVKILTHAGQYTANENIPELPMPGDIPHTKDYVIGYNNNNNNIVKLYRMRKIKCYENDQLIGVGWEHYNNEYYHNGVKIEDINVVQTIPDSSESNVGNYYVTSMEDQHLYVSQYDFGAEQSVSYITGGLIFKNNGLPQLIGEESIEVQASQSTEVYVLDTDDMSEDSDNFIIGYNQRQVTIGTETKTVQVPIYKLKAKQFRLNTQYILACMRRESKLGINEEGMVGTYNCEESADSVKYCLHVNYSHGFDGTFSFTPKENYQDKQVLRDSYVQGKAIKGPGNVTIDKIFIDGLLK